MLVYQMAFESTKKQDNAGFGKSVPAKAASLGGIEIIDFESESGKYSRANLDEIKRKYANFVSEVCRKVEKRIPDGKNKRLDETAIKKLVSEVTREIGVRFEYGDTKYLSDAFVADKGMRLDCDTSAFVVADVIRKFGVQSKIVLVPVVSIKQDKDEMPFYIGGTMHIPTLTELKVFHAILKIEMPRGKEIYFETTSNRTGFSRLLSYSSKKEVEDRYLHIDGEQNSARRGGLNYIIRGTDCASNGKYDMAIKDYNEAIRLFPKSALAYSARSQVYLAKKNYPLAQGDAEKAISLNIMIPGPHTVLGDVFLYQKKYAKAIEEYSSAIDMDSKNPELFKKLSEAYSKNKEYQNAESAFKRYLELKVK